jgi:15-cis-phytoene synthase
MADHTSVGYMLAEEYTKRYSTSFSLSSRLFSSAIRPHIYAIYGLVRMADEIVDTFAGTTQQKAKLLNELQGSVHDGIAAGYNTNPMLHAFIATAIEYNIDRTLIDPFFESMRMDLTPFVATQKLYEKYIFGSAEVIGLMCLKVFVAGDRERYHELQSGAQALGSAYQKVNFLRDMASDYAERGRMYFPGVAYNSMSEADKNDIVNDIRTDFTLAEKAIPELPRSARIAVRSSYLIYSKLLHKLSRQSVEDIKSERIRVPALHKMACLIKASVKELRA